MKTLALLLLLLAPMAAQTIWVYPSGFYPGEPLAAVPTFPPAVAQIPIPTAPDPWTGPPTYSNPPMLSAVRQPAMSWLPDRIEISLTWAVGMDPTWGIPDPRIWTETVAWVTIGPPTYLPPISTFTPWGWLVDAGPPAVSVHFDSQNWQDAGSGSWRATGWVGPVIYYAQDYWIQALVAHRTTSGWAMAYLTLGTVASL